MTTLRTCRRCRAAPVGDDQRCTDCGAFDEPVTLLPIPACFSSEAFRAALARVRPPRSADG